jgi:hypothetical protein
MSRFSGSPSLPPSGSNSGKEGIEAVSKYDGLIPNPEATSDLWDWSPSIQKAIDECVLNKKDMVELRGNKTYTIKSPILIKRGVTLKLGVNTRIRVDGNFRVFEFELDSSLIGGTIDIVNSTFTNDVIYLDGKNNWYQWNKTRIEDVAITNSSGVLGGTALSLFSGTTNWHCISFVNFINLRINNFNKGIYLNAPPPTSTMVYINANRFLDISMENCVHFIDIDGTEKTPNECSGNDFKGLQVQLTENTQTFLTMDGSYNTIEGLIWDTHKLSHTNPIIILSAKTIQNRVYTNLFGQEWIVDQGSYNHISSPKEDMLYGKSMPPSDPSKHYIVGDQDDVLVNADKLYTVTQLAGSPKVGSAFSAMFDLLKESWTGWDNSTEVAPIVLEINFGTTPISYFKSVGMVFSGTESPKYIKYEFATASTGVYNQSETFPQNTSSTVQSYRFKSANVYRLKITMWGSNNASTNRIKLTRIFATAGQTRGNAWISTQGGKMFGDMELARSTDGLILTSPDGSRWKLSISNTGVTAWVKI